VIVWGVRSYCVSMGSEELMCECMGSEKLVWLYEG
jgi:hypothetical protein